LKRVGTGTWRRVLRNGILLRVIWRVQGIRGQKGAYTLYSKGQAVDEKEVVVTMVDECYHEKVWEHTLKLFDDMERSGRTA
jgi:hypothetical protein